MTQARDGRIVTFYSFKGGTGRTMALANVAWLLASSGLRVLAVDWDLESPGLPRYFNPFLSGDAVRDAAGVIDLIREFDTEAARRRRRKEEFAEIASYARVDQYAMSLKWRFPKDGSLDFMSSGRQNTEYATTIGNLGWDNFYDKLGGGLLFDALRANMKANYDYTLIDSRTGFGDISEICVKHLPDTLVNCFTLNTQGIEGAVGVAADLEKYRFNGMAKRIRVLPVPMRVDEGEQEKAATGRGLARRRFEGLPADMSAEQRQAYWANVEIPYRVFYAYEEILAAFGDESAGPNTLLGAYGRLTRYITDDAITEVPLIEDGARARGLQAFERTAPSTLSEVRLVCEPEDAAWAEWIGRVLGSVGVAVAAPGGLDASGDAGAKQSPLTLAVVSRFSREPSAPGLIRPSARELDRYREHGGELRVLYVADVPPQRGLPAGSWESLAGRSAEEAARRLTGLVRAESVAEERVSALSEHYPERVPRINNTPARNSLFTGRDAMLRALREGLRARGRMAVIPDKLPSGVGKTQLALEYVHRYKSEYDAVYWIECGQPQFIDIAMADLGRALNAKYGGQIAIDAGGSAEDEAAAVRDALAQGRPVRRWLLVFDNATEPAAIKDYLPEGSGHVLITSRNRAWDQIAPHPLEVGVFDHDESVAHLRWRVPSISQTDAEDLAEALGHLPMAVAVTGAWLSDTGIDVPEYLRRLAERGPTAIPAYPEDSPLDDYSANVVASIDSALDAVGEQSAAYRLLELCSFLSEGGISLNLIYTPAVLELLSAFDKRLAEPGDIARHVQQLHRRALIKLDNQARQFTIHRLLHARIRQRMAAEEQATIRHQVHVVLAMNRPRRSVDDPETWSRFRMLWPHLEPSDAAACGDEHVRALLIDRVRYIWAVGTLPQTDTAARDIEKRWLSMLDTASESDDAPTLRMQLLHLQFNIANVLRDQGKYEEAWELDTKVLEEQRSLLGSEHRHTLTTAGGYAADLRALGRYREAAGEAEDTYRVWMRVYGEDHERTLFAANNLAVSYRLVGRFAEARELDEATYTRRQTSLMGAGHPETLRSATALGRDYREAGEYGRSVAWLTDVVATASSQPEPNRRAVAVAQVNLAASLRAAGRAGDAAPIFAEAVRTLSELLGTEHPETLAGRLGECSNLQALEKFGRADEELQEVLAGFRELVGGHHPLTLVCASNRVALLRSLDDTDEAVRLGRETVEALTGVLGEQHPYTLAAQMNLAVCLADNGDLTQALSLDNASVRELSLLLGSGHPDALRAAANVALTRSALGEPGADEELERLLGRMEQWVSREHPSVRALRDGKRSHRLLDPQLF